MRRDAGPSPAGDVEAVTTVDGRRLSTIGHVFHPFEVDALVDGIPGLRVRARHHLDYATGAPVDTCLEGQVLYEVVRAV
jgi:hypothetical protein